MTLKTEKYNIVVATFTLASILMAGCASNSEPVPQRFSNERIEEEYMRGGEVLPKDEEIFYSINANRVPNPGFCYLPSSPGYEQAFGKMFITDNATYYVSTYGTPQITEIWNYKENLIKAEHLDYKGLWSCVVITEHTGRATSYAIFPGATKRVIRLINYFVKKAQGEEN